MRRVVLDDGADFETWRARARELLAGGAAPDQVQWQVGQDVGLFDGLSLDDHSDVQTPKTGKVPRQFMELASTVLAHNDPRRHAVLYRLLWRLTHGERNLLKIVTDDDVSWTALAAKAVRRDMHKMKAFVRFREVAGPDGSVFIAWFEPSHDIVTRVAPFFVRRFTGMRWSILTPLRSAHWNGESLSFGAGAKKGDAPGADALEDLWRTYFANIFNPARLKVKAMTQEMPVRYWKNLPEATLIPELIRDASARMQMMVDKAPTVAQKRIPAPVPREPAVLLEGSIAQLREQARHCRACPVVAAGYANRVRRGPGRCAHRGDRRTGLAIRKIWLAGHSRDLRASFSTVLLRKRACSAAPYMSPTRSSTSSSNRAESAAYTLAPMRRSRLRVGSGSRPSSIASDLKRSFAWAPWQRRVFSAAAFDCSSSEASGSSLTMASAPWLPCIPSYLLRLRDEDARSEGFEAFVRDLALMRQVVSP